MQKINTTKESQDLWYLQFRRKICPFKKKSEYGKNNDLWWDKVNGQLPEQQALAEVGYSCQNRRSYTSMNIK